MSIAMTVAPATSEPASPRKYLNLPQGQALNNRQDSGYATQSSSPDGKSAEPTSVRDSCVSTQSSESTTVDNKARPIPLALTPVADLAEFDKSVDDDTLSRFRHLHAQIEKPLLAYIRSRLPGRKYRPIALRLMVLGRSEDDAKPCIVVFCPEQQSKRVRKFFDKSSVRALCRPEDDNTPSFNVFVLGRPVETKHGDDDVDVFISIMGESEVYTTETYCGAPIIIRQPSGAERRCTFGGIIKTVSLDGDVKLYGLTVGHVLFGDSDDDLTVGTMSDGAEPLDDWAFQLSDSESEDEPDDLAGEDLDGIESLHAIESLQLAWEDTSDTSQSWASLEVGKIGCVSKASMQSETATANTNGEESKPFYDWALIDMESYKPNRLRARKLPNGEVRDGAFKSGELVMPAMPPRNSGKRQPVVLLSGSEGPKRGSLSALPSRLLLGPGKAFVDTLVLGLDDDKQILNGDSGSWVVNERTLEVYGYVVAVDAFGGGYVIPLHEAFRNIVDSLGFLSVDLATVVDMATVKLGRERDLTVKMADSLSIASSVVVLVAFAFTSSTVLYTTVLDFKSQDKNSRALKYELADLRGVLQLLAETIDNNSNISFDILKLPLLRCGKTCEEYGDLIARCMKHSSPSQLSLQNWISQKYLKGDITDFRDMLAGYKSIINLALANAYTRVITSITPYTLENYKDFIRDTTNDLQEYVKRLEERGRALAASEAESPIRDEPELMAILEEKQSTQEGLKISLQLSARIEQLESISKEHPQFLQQPSSQESIRSGLGAANASIQSLVSRLQTGEHDIDKIMEAKRSAVPFSEHEATQLAQLQETKESIRQCMSVVANAGETLTNERCNIFEDMTTADSSYSISVSAVKDLIVARQRNLRGRSRQLGGHISDESYRRTIDDLTQPDLESVKSNGQGVEQTPSAHGLNNGGVVSHGFER